MGAWGSGPFDNDGAGDLLADLGTTRTPAAKLRKALRTVGAAPAGAYIDVDDGQAAWAAAELVACALGRPGGAPLDPAYALLLPRLGADDDLRILAARAVSRVGDAEGSEVAELWQEAGDPAFEENICDLLLRLTP
jgi:hypothetical protein